MLIYFLLIIFVLFVPLLCANIQDRKVRKKRILFLSLFAIYLMMALKAPSVGRDISGYKKVYDSMINYTWNNYDATWMEWGYEFLMMIFVHIFHASFQVFMACVYAYLYLSYGIFFKRYSEDITTSLILYICFTFLTFDASAVRTMIGVGTCLYSIPFAQKKGIKNTLLFFAITLTAAQIHKSAYIFILAYFVIKTKITSRTIWFYIVFPLGIMIFRSRLYVLINAYFKTVTETGASVGGNLLIYIAAIIVTLFIWLYYIKKSNINFFTLTTGKTSDVANDYELLSYFYTSGLALRMVYMGIFIQLFSTGTVLSRMAQYMQIFIVVLLANDLTRLDRKSKFISKMVLYSLAILYFWYFSLRANSLDIVPYKFFWNI